MNASTFPGVITVSYGSQDALTDFLSSLFEQHPDFPPLNVVVVDNKPDHENVAELAHRHGVKYVSLPHNPGYGAGMNAGVQALREAHTAFDSLFFCNPDVRFIEPVITQLSAALLSDPTIGSIGPQLLNTDGSVYPSARAIPSVGTGIGHALFRSVWPSNPWTRAYTQANEYTHTRDAGSLSGAAVMTSVTAYDALQGWDEAYFMHFEDIDLGWRLGRLGYRNVYSPSVAVEHSGAHSTKAHAAVVERAMTESAIRFLCKRYDGVWRAPMRAIIVCGLRVRGWLRLRSLRT